MKRFASRKFIMALAAQVTGLLVLIWPAQEAGIAAAVEAVAALAVVILSSLGYVAAEASVDRAGRSAGSRRPDHSQS